MAATKAIFIALNVFWLVRPRSQCGDKIIWLLGAAFWATHRKCVARKRKLGQTELVEYATALECKCRIVLVVMKHLSKFRIESKREAYAASWRIDFSVHGTAVWCGASCIAPWSPNG